jgi:hypothetical protein
VSGYEDVMAYPSGANAPKWWTSATPGRDAIAIARTIEAGTDHQARRRQSLRHLKLYANRDLQSLYDCGVAVGAYDAGVYLTMNVIQSCADTVASKLWKTPRIQASVQDGDWALKQRAKKLTAFGDGLWYANKWAAESRQTGVEATLFGSGVVQVTPEDTKDGEGEVVIERCLVDEIIFDETEAIGGLRTLRTIYRKRWVHRQVLLDKWLSKDGVSKKDRELRRLAILSASGANPREFYTVSAAEMIPVYEAWHLPSTPGADDGMHLIAVPGIDEYATLFKGPWKRRRFPFSFLPWTRLPTGLIGRSLAEELVPIQIRLNELLETIDAGQRLMCVPKVFFQGDTIDINTWTNAFCELIQVNGPPSSIRYEVGKGASQEIYDDRGFWWQHAFEATGISMLSATAQKPEGVSSAVALRELLDREDMRLTPKGKQWEEFHVDVFENCVDAADELAERERVVQVQVPGKSVFKTIQWRGKKGVDMERDRYILRADAVNALPSTPQGRKQYAVELWQLGAIERPRFLEMLELPDTTSTMNLILASLELTEKAMGIMVEDDRYEPPEEYSDLVLARTYAMQTYLKERMDDAPEKILLRLLRYIDECSEMLAANDNGAGAVTAGATAAQAQPQAQGNLAPGTAVPEPEPLPPAGPGELQPTPETMATQPGAAVAA